MTIVCGDSHTATHGAFGALAFGIGTSEVEHVLATQTLLQFKPKTFELRVDGELPRGVTAKDMILYLIGQIGTAGGTGYVLEYTGDCVRALSMEERMTVCNMSIEAGARAGMIAPDQTTFDYLRGRPKCPPILTRPSSGGNNCRPTSGASYDRSEVYQGADIEPQVTWGTNPGQVLSVTDRVPDPADFGDATEQKSTAQALEYMGLTAKTPIQRYRHRSRLHRVVYQCTDRRPARGRGSRQGTSRGDQCRRDGRSRQRSSQRASRTRRPGQGLQGSRLRLARSGLQHVSGDESRQTWHRVSAVPAPATATSKAAKAKGAARIWSVPRWRRPPPSKDTLSISASGITNRRRNAPVAELGRVPQPLAIDQHLLTRISAVCRLPLPKNPNYHAKLHHPHRHRRHAGSCQRRHRPDHSETISQTDRTNRISASSCFTIGDSWMTAKRPTRL